MLITKDLSAGYGKTVILRNINIEVHPGEIVAIIGRNGVGKTTLIKSVIGLIKPLIGNIYFKDHKITSLEAYKRARLGIGYVPQGRGIFPKLSVEENLLIGKLINSHSNINQNKSPQSAYSYFPRLQERQSQKAETMSGGEQSMLAIARALIGQPDLLLLDEPSEGVQPNVVAQIGSIIEQINREIELTVLLVEQNLDLIQHIAHRCYVMDKGNIVASLERSELADQQQLIKFLAI
ncbi:ABC transporter ATP-binding protein [Leptolyngbya sp. NK1-12]|uniref:ABC transporter ATP-binding protein n=1 Tax=Leptolyngbya sp. NK1-12 TaxID=2547451 RepID=A0AA96WKY9_9CYAN|nr:ABC transporter ATP-binding protein [Leptolyngbya sp. NK1-12]WNZ24141.1 ABC transporter ATP-binding protein [Leptolyngbya sp. NK1-12]